MEIDKFDSVEDYIKEHPNGSFAKRIKEELEDDN